MNKSILLTLAVLVLSCNQPNESLDTAQNKERFNKNVNSFKEKFVAGFKTEDPDLMMSLFADSLKWNNPEVKQCLVFLNQSKIFLKPLSSILKNLTT